MNGYVSSLTVSQPPFHDLLFLFPNKQKKTTKKETAFDKQKLTWHRFSPGLFQHLLNGLLLDSFGDALVLKLLVRSLHMSASPFSFPSYKKATAASRSVTKSNSASAVARIFLFSFDRCFLKRWLLISLQFRTCRLWPGLTDEGLLTMVSHTGSCR